MRIVQLVISLFIVAVATFSVLGILWWNSPPEKLAGYATGGRVILGVLVAGCAVGLWQLWTPARPKRTH